MTRLIFGFLVCAFATASFVDTYRYKDYDTEQQNEYYVEKLLRLLRSDEYNRENNRNIQDENWNGRWMPDRLGDPKPSPKVLPISQQQYQYESVTDLPVDMHWTGRWMPDRLGDPTPPPKVLPKNQQQHEYESMTEPSHIHMGHVSPDCDDAKTNLTVDWNHTPSEYTCYGHNIIPSKITPILYCEKIPKAYQAAHKCMNQKIEYDDDIPLYGPHRPLWPVYGEYKFVPKQRWLHSLEHGAIVMLYHPCANPLEVDRLRNLVNKCLWRHIITPYSYLDEERPLALLSWGCRLTMSYVNPTIVSRFIRKRALRGPEKTAKDGQFEDGLLSRSSVVTDPVDSELCPTM
ncbi:uncharacterized protein LOC105426224 isoform X1 [Pogonomyrmex barbatus]|uniref:Uncharacterized protein LOC105426224 isoform X1 n=2 Tax=Pogonomyrmex barbatus TaxID=144034 RepID=A0A6I9WA10_9HYME|nr:uncharacterized protein LOC105426224 isoform X1 [Pogonomyrmex barbatus]